jgi:putative oxidoreductase
MNQQPHQPSLLNRIARVLLCLVFIHAVIGKLTGFAGVAGAIAAKGLPLAPVLLVAAMALMAVGSALVISGWKARLGAVLLLLFLVPTTCCSTVMLQTRWSGFSCSKTWQSWAACF